MKFSTAIAPAVLASSVLAAPSRTDSSLKARSSTMCGQWDTMTEGTYTIYQDLWGEAQASSGSQCTTVTGLTNGKLAWSTSWTWAGGSSSVKSYANAALQDIGKELSAISTIPSTWDWSYTGSNIVGDVSYDMWLAPSASGTNDYEIMVWLAAIGGAGPISSTGSTVATPTIDGTTWKLYTGPNGDTTVFSFVAETEQTAFSGDLMAFFTYLIDNENVPNTHYLTSIGAGTEPFTGTSAVLTTSAFSVAVN